MLLYQGCCCCFWCLLVLNVCWDDGKWVSRSAFFPYGSLFRLLVLSDVYVELDRGVLSLCMWFSLGVCYAGGSTLVRIKTLCLSSKPVCSEIVTSSKSAFRNSIPLPLLEITFLLFLQEFALVPDLSHFGDCL